MPTGKQTSFQYGEVSPALQYRSSESSYAMGLSRLKNCYVRSEGGISNRPGLVSLRKALSQENINPHAPIPGVRGFSFFSPVNKVYERIEYAYFPDAVVIPDPPNPDIVLDGYAFAFENQAEKVPANALEEGPLPSEIRMTVLKDRLFFTPSVKVGVSFQANDNINTTISPYTSGQMNNNGNFALSVGANITNTGPLPASGITATYLITAEYSNGAESVCFAQGGYSSDWGVTQPSPVAHPTADFGNLVQVQTLAAAGVKSFNLYRAIGTQLNISNAMWRLVSKVPYAGVSPITLADFGSEVAGVTAPVDRSFLNNFGIVVGINNSAYYQQRLIGGVEPGALPTFESGDVVASKLGSPTQFQAPIITTELGAFKFTVPIVDGSPVVGMLSMDRLILMTERGVFVVRGGEQGILAPLTINPTRISDEGASRRIEPKMSGDRGYFVNASETKIMGIIFGLDGNLKVYEVSRNSKHLLRDGILQIEAINASENMLAVLTKAGKLVIITCHEDYTCGFATAETKGRIESIFSHKHFEYMDYSKIQDCLFAYVIRDGTRWLEKIDFRRSTDVSKMAYSDAAVAWGYRFLGETEDGFRLLDSASFDGFFTGYDTGFSETSHSQINLVATDWSAGEIITIQKTSQLDVAPGTDFRICVFYKDSQGKGKRSYIEVDLDSEVEVFGEWYSYTYEATLEEDVPEEIRDIHSRTDISTYEKNYQKTNWLPAFNKISSPSLLTVYRAGKEIPTGEWDFSQEVAVSIFADGEVISSPNNPHRPVLMLQPTGVEGDWDATIELPGFYCNAIIGIPYDTEMTTLDIEASDGRTFTSSGKNVSQVGVAFNETYQSFVGMPNKSFTDMEEMLIRDEEDFGVQAQEIEGFFELSTPTEWNKHGRVSIKNPDPVPMTILSVYPSGLIGD